MAPHDAAIDHRRTDTRDRILSVSLRLFATHGYANTSLREISDELGVTKAALYFHFKTKEDILSGIMRDNLDSINAITDSAEPLNATLAGREELLRRLAASQATWSMHLVKLVRENFTEISNLSFGAEIKDAQRRLLDALAGPEAALIDKIRARTAFIAVQSASLVAESEDMDEADVRDASLTVALEVLRGR